MTDPAYLKVAALRALLDRIGPTVAGVQAEVGGSVLELIAVAPSGLSTRDRELLDEALTELIADFPEVSEAHLVELRSAAGDPKALWIFRMADDRARR